MKNGFKINGFSFDDCFSSLNIDSAWLPVLESRLKEISLADVEQASKTRESNQSLISIDNSPSSDLLGLLDIRGVLLYSCPAWLEPYGFSGYDLIESRFNALMNDPRVKTILIRAQSPGGTAFGASELSEKIFNARSEKRIVAYADPYAFSAAYEIASAASVFYSTRSGMVGSIGSYSMHVDISESLKNEGVKIEFIKAGEKKTDGNSYEPLSERARVDIQEEVDRFYEVFVQDVARNRGVSADFVKENFGKGGRVMAPEAVQVGMIDGIASLDQILNAELTELRNQNTLTQNRAFVALNTALLELEEI